MRRHPRTPELKIARSGGSRAVRLLRGKRDERLSWEATYREMAREKEDWGNLDGTLADGLAPGDKW